VTEHAPPAHVDVSLWRLDRLTDEVADLRALLSEDEIARAARFFRAVDRDRWTVARAGLRLLLSEALNTTPGAIAFGQEGNGRPEVIGVDSLSFNLSHSADVAALAISRDARVGVDVEEIRPVGPDEIAWALSLAEQKALAQVGKDESLETFFRYWTMKEAFMKGTGLGASLPLHDFDVELGVPGLVRLRDNPEAPRLWSFHEISPRPGMRGAVSALTAGRSLVANWLWIELQ
jgi:4'-phosphopantetheinyl transferase